MCGVYPAWSHATGTLRKALQLQLHGSECCWTTSAHLDLELDLVLDLVCICLVDRQHIMRLDASLAFFFLAMHFGAR
jgi:hypothetical protein